MINFLRSWFARWRVVWLELLPARGGGRRSASVATGAVPYKRAGRSKKKARAFRAAIDGVLSKFAAMKTRKAIRALMRLPPVDIGLSESFMTEFEKYLGDMPRCPAPEAWDLLGAANNAINVCLMGKVFDDDGDEDRDDDGSMYDADRIVGVDRGTSGWYVGHFRTVSLRTLRGRSLRRQGPINLNHRQMRKGYVPSARDPLTAAHVIAADYVFKSDERDGEYTAQRVAISSGNNRWKMIEHDGRLVGHLEEARLARIAHAIDWGNRFLWEVTIKVGPIAARYHCTARNVLELLWMRNKDAGRRRRKAMIHLVRPHERRLPSGKTTTVRPHLRGALECTWRDWQITIKPSDHDYQVLERRMLPGQDMMEFIEANCDLLASPADVVAA